MTATLGIGLPNELERKQIFHSLQRWSSSTAWKRIRDLYRAWLDAGEESLRQARLKGLQEKTGIHESRLRLIRKGLAHLEEAVVRLERGDKRIFKYASYSELTHARKPMDQEFDQFWRFAIGENSIDRETTPGWDEYEQAFARLFEGWEECSSKIVQPDYYNSFQPVSETFFNDALKAELGRMSFPDPLPAVPDPEPSVLIRTGKVIGHCGIWEPVDAPAPKFLDWFRSAKPQGPFPVVGTMAYLHASTIAPNMATHHRNGWGEPTTWRLLWRDDRYLGGVVPEQEKHYVFLQAASTDGILPSESDIRPS